MKRPSNASLRKVTAENLAGLGADRLAEILFGVAQTRPDLKRRLRMELAARQGPEHLTLEIDKRLGAIETSRGQVTWRQRPALVRELGALRGLIAERLCAQDPSAAAERLWRFLSIARPISRRLKGRDESVAGVFAQAAAELGGLIAEYDPVLAANALIEAVAREPALWIEWLPGLLQQTSPALAEQALRLMSERRDAVPGWLTLVRQVADAAGDVDAFAATYDRAGVETPTIAAGVGRRFLAAGRVDAAGQVLRAAAPKPSGRNGRLPAPDFDWETAWIAYLDQAGDLQAAQAVRWSAFERTLSVDRVKAFASRLSDFADVEAEARAFDYAARHPDFERGLRFLMAWPALGEAARMISARPDDIDTTPEDAEVWAAKLQHRHPAAARMLLRKAAAAAFRRRQFKTCDRLTQAANAISS